MRVWVVAFGLLVAAWSARAEDTVGYGRPPAWVEPPPEPTGTAAPAGAAVQVIYSDSQVRLGPDGDEFHTAYRLKILAPEALALGNIIATWSPDTDDIHVHRLNIIRDGRASDVLAKTRFDVMKRENNLELSVLDGDLTASIQTPGLRVGDEIEFAVTIRRRDPLLRDWPQGAMAFAAQGAPGAYRMRLSWPKSKPLRWWASPDLGEFKPMEGGGDYVLSRELRDPKTAITADGAPPRENLRRFVQYTSFTSWAEASALLSPLFEKASALAPDSQVKVEVTRIAAQTSSQKERVEAALRLVQEHIRYVYVDLDGGNFRPATADETWTRRFGDCKGKTALLLALLRELGVPAEAALVNFQGGDGADALLPSLSLFNHVVVRATVDGRPYWLDGTRLGDRRLDLIPPPVFQWALPIRPQAADLVQIAAIAPVLALEGVILDVDATKGFDAPAAVKAEWVVRGDAASAFKTTVSQLSTEDTERALKAYWIDHYSWVEPDTVSWRYDEQQAMALLTMTGETRPEWEGDAENGRSLDIYSAGFYRPEEFRRPKEQDQTAPWTVDFPDYKRWTTVIRLPPEKNGWRWTYNTLDVDEEIGGVRYRREAELRDGVMRVTKSRRSLKPEISAQEAQADNKKRSDFDNRISQVYQYKEEDLGAYVAEARAEAGRNPEKLVALGGELLGDGENAAAEDVFTAALRIDPTLPAAITGRAFALERQGHLEKALSLLAAASKVHAGPEIGLARVHVLANAGRKDEAISIIDTMLKAYAEDPDTLSALAYAAHENGLSAQAAAAAEAGLKLAPDDTMLLQIKASTTAGVGDWSKALPMLDAVAKLEPENPANLLNRSVAYRRLGRLDEALADIDEALRSDPLSDQFINAKVRTLIRAGRGPEAVALSDAAHPKSSMPKALNNRCWERALANLDLTEAEASCGQAVKAAPKEAAYWDSYALVAMRMGRLDEAISRYDRALALNARLAPALYGRGLARLRKGDEDAGRADIAAAKAISAYVGDELADGGLTP